MKRWLMLGLLATTLAWFPPLYADAADTVHRVAIQVSNDDPAVMALALNNANSILEDYARKGETVRVEIVTFGPGLTMLRDDTSPVKERLHALLQSHPEIQLSACANTRRSMARREGKDIPLVPEATEVPSGAGRLIDLQEQGWSYLRP